MSCLFVLVIQVTPIYLKNKVCPMTCQAELEVT